MIAIVPKLGPAQTAATATSSQVPPATNAAKQPFSEVLEQAKPSPSEALLELPVGTQSTALESFSPVNALHEAETNASDSKAWDSKASESKASDSKSWDSKSSDSKTSESRARGNASTHKSVSGADAQDKTVPVVIVHPQTLQAPQWSAASALFIPATVVTGAEISGAPLDAKLVIDKPANPALSASGSLAEPKTPGQSAPWPTLSKDAGTAKVQEGTSNQDSPKLASLPSTTADAIKAEAVAGLMKNLSGTTKGDSKTQPSNTPLQGRNPVRGSGETNEGVNRPQAVVKSEVEPVLVPPSVPPSLAAPVPSPALPGKLETSSSPNQQVLDKAKSSSTQETSATGTKSSDVTGAAKPQFRKDDTSYSSGSQGSQTGTLAAPTKATESSTAFTVAGIQSPAGANDSRTVAAIMPRNGSDPQFGQFEQKPTAAAHSPEQGESAAVYPTSLVHSAKLVERIGEAELRLGIRAGEFGSVDIRTSMVRNQFTAEISTERGELGRALAAELPSLHNRLTEQHVPVANITVQSHTGSQSAASEQQKPRDGQQAYATTPAGKREESSIPAFVAAEATLPASRLDIHM